MSSPTTRDHTKRLAVLIDADNASAKIIEPLLREVAKYGDANVRRIYGDWTRPGLAAWKSSLCEFAIQPIQQFSYTVGKNASDSALIIDAMDLLYSGSVDGICIVSSDSDFTRLACRLRESGISVYGFGEKKTPTSFVRACDRFVYVENLVPSADDRPPSPAAGAAPAKSPTNTAPSLSPEQKKRILAALDEIAPGGGWVPLSVLGMKLPKLSPPIHYKACGFGKLSKMIRVVGELRLGDKGTNRVRLANGATDGNSGPKHLYVAPDPHSSDGK